MKITRKGKDYYQDGKYVGSIEGDREMGYFFEWADGSTFGFTRWLNPVRKDDRFGKSLCLFRTGCWAYFQDAVKYVKANEEEIFTTKMTQVAERPELQEYNAARELAFSLSAGTYQRLRWNDQPSNFLGAHTQEGKFFVLYDGPESEKPEMFWTKVYDKVATEIYL